jgi:hypothetical protein
MVASINQNKLFMPPFSNYAFTPLGVTPLPLSQNLLNAQNQTLTSLHPTISKEAITVLGSYTTATDFNPSKDSTNPE